MLIKRPVFCFEIKRDQLSIIGCRGILLVLIFTSCTYSPQSKIHIDEENFILIEAIINKEKMNFIFDTCAEATVIAKGLAEALGLSAHRSITINNIPVDIVYIPTLEINGIKLFQVEAAVIDMSNETFSNGGYGGILGLNVINLFVWDFDLIKRKLQIYQGKPKLKTNAAVIDYQKIEQTGLPFVQIHLDFFQSDAVFFDTGFTGFLSANHLKDTALLEFNKFTESQKFLFGAEDQMVAHYTARDFELFGKYFEEQTLIHNVHPKRDKDFIGSLFVQSFNRFVFNPIDSQILLELE